MFKKISLRWRITLLTSFLIAVCCIGLSIMLNRSAYRMVDVIDASVVQPAKIIENADMASIQTLPSESITAVKLAKSGYLFESFIYTMIAVFAGGVFTYYISGKALEPIRILNEQVKNITSHSLKESLEIPPAGDELSELTESFNDMTDKLAQAFAMQKRFSADAAHEFRTPLSALQTKLDVFKKKEQHSLEEYMALTAVFEKQVKRLRTLVTELLEIANLEHEFQRQDISVELLLEDIVSELVPVAEEKDIVLVLDNNDYSVCGEYVLLYRAFYNLIENAIKYNIPGGNIAIHAEKQDKNIIVSIKDTGIGIPDSMKKQIFEPFCRVDKSRSRDMGGAGLGLSLADSILKKHNGTIVVADNDDKGSCFKVILPANE